MGPIDFDLMVFSLREVIKNAALFFVSCVTPAFMLLEIEFFPLILLNLVPPFDSCGRIFCPKKDRPDNFFSLNLLLVIAAESFKVGIPCNLHFKRQRPSAEKMLLSHEVITQ